MSESEGSIKPNIDSRYEGLASVQATKLGPLGDLFRDKFAYQFLQYPLNLESSEQKHWVRFDIQEIQGVGIRTNAGRTVVDVVKPPGEKEPFLTRITEGSAELFQKGKSLAVKQGTKFATKAARTAAISAADSLPPALAGIGKKFISGYGRSKGLGSIMLFAPQGRAESMGANWGSGENIGQSGEILARKLNGGLTGELMDVVLASGAIAAQDKVADIASGLAGNPALAEVYHRHKGHAVNPHLEMFFKGVDMRTFTFVFKMAPRNKPEAQSIHEICTLFKFASAPSLQNSLGQHFKYPEVFDISFSNEDKTNKINQSALTKVDISHGADGVNTTFYDGYPLETTLTLTFTELQILTKEQVREGY